MTWQSTTSAKTDKFVSQFLPREVLNPLSTMADELVLFRSQQTELLGEIDKGAIAVADLRRDIKNITELLELRNQTLANLREDLSQLQEILQQNVSVLDGHEGAVHADLKAMQECFDLGKEEIDTVVSEGTQLKQAKLAEMTQLELYLEEANRRHQWLRDRKAFLKKEINRIAKTKVHQEMVFQEETVPEMLNMVLKKNKSKNNFSQGMTQNLHAISRGSLLGSSPSKEHFQFNCKEQSSVSTASKQKNNSPNCSKGMENVSNYYKLSSATNSVQKKPSSNALGFSHKK